MPFDFSCLALCWGQEDVEGHGKHDEEEVSHDAHPESRVPEELLIVAAEEHVADGHARYAASNVGNEGDLAGTGMSKVR